MTTTCPPRDHLARFLNDRLDPTDEAILGQHLEECSACVAAMEALTQSVPVPAKDSSTLSLRPARSGLPSSELSRLRQLLPPTGSYPNPPPAPHPPGLPEIPGYEIERELGRGGMGIVYLARQTPLNRRVALKMILAGANATPDETVRFLAEAQTCAGLRHENIVQVFEVSQHAGRPYFSMEYVDGGTLADRVRHQAPTPREAAALVEQLALAMHAAHKQGVVHRDLKPVNILLSNAEWTSDDGQPTAAFPSALRTPQSALRPKITDFGLAKHFERSGDLTQTGAILGTPDYMAPEQVASGLHPVGPSADIHALGAVLYFLLAGRPPFAAHTPMETLARVKDAEPLSPSQLQRGIPRDLSIICLRCLEKRPDRRYASAEALADDLNRFLHGQPILARPVTELERLWKWAGRNPAAASLSAALLLVVLVALGLVSWQWYVADAARGREAKRANDEAEAKQAEAKTRREAQLLSSGYALDQGIQECRGGRIAPGLALMVDALELLPDGEPDLEFAIRANIGAWRERLCPAIKGRHVHGTAVVSVAFSPDGQSVLVGDWGNSMGHAGRPAFVGMFDANHFDGPPIWSAEQKAAAWSLAFSPDGRRVAVGGFDGTVSIRDAKTGALQSTLPHGGCVTAVAFSPDGQTLAVGGSSTLAVPLSGRGELRFWNPCTGEALGEPVALPTRLYSLAWHRDGRAIALGGVDPNAASGSAGIAAIFDVERRELVGPAMIHTDTVAAMAFHPNGATLATGCRDGLVRFWSYPESQLQHTRSAGAFPSNLPKLLRHPQPVTSLSFSRTGDLLASASGHHDPGVRAGHGEVRIWDATSGTLLMTPHFAPSPGNSQKMHSVAFGDGDRKLVAACEHGSAWLWLLPPPQSPHLDFAVNSRTDIFHSPDGRTLLLALVPERQIGFGGKPCELRIVAAADGRTIAALPHPTMVQVRFSPDSRRFFTFTNAGAREPGVWLWDAANGQSVPLPENFDRKLLDVRFTLDGTAILTVAADGTFRLWDAAALAPLGEPRPGLEPNESLLSIDDAGTRLLALGPDAARLVSLPDGRKITAFDIGPLTANRTGGGRPLIVVGFTADGSTVAAALIDEPDSARRWRAHDGLRLGSPAHGGNWVMSLRHPDGVRFLLTEANGTTSRLWNATTGELSPIPIPVHGIVAIHPGGQLIAATQANTADHCQLWGLAGKPIGPPFPHALLNDVQFNPNGRWLVTSSNDKSVKVWPLFAPAFGSPADLRAAIR